MTRGTKADAGDAFLDGAWVTMRDLEQEHNCSIEFVIERSGRPGVFVLHFVALDLNMGERFAKPMARYRIDYPNAGVMGLCAAIFQAVHKLDSMVDEVRVREMKRPRII